MHRILCIGLGNPGAQYERTRHNAGWIVLDQLVQLWSDPSIPLTWKKEKNVEAEVLRLQHNNCEWIFLKPLTFMNESGKSVASACKWYLNLDPTISGTETEYKNILVLHDDLDIELGRHKLQFASGPKVHNGINSIRDHLHSNNFWTARLGVDTRQGDRSMPGRAYVLQTMTQDELKTLKSLAGILAEEFPYTVLS